MRKVLVCVALGIMVVAAGLLYLQTQLESSYLARYILWNESEVEDKDKFPVRAIENAPPPFYFDTAEASELFQAIELTGAGTRGPVNLDQFLAANQTTSFIVIHHDKILYEKYFNGYSRDSIVTSFSSAKSFGSLLVGMAIDDGSIESVQDPIIRYLPELRGRGLDELTIKHLLTMASGIRFTHLELFGLHVDMPWDDNPRTYYEPNMRELALSVRPGDEPIGKYFRYNNYHPLLLGLILERSTGQSVSHYLQNKIWKPLGMEHPASWSLDSRGSGFEKMESGINARAIDFAKVGLLMLHNGDWHGTQLLSKDWVRESTTPDPNDTRPWQVFAENRKNGGYYKYMWWGRSMPNGDYSFWAAGKYGQYIFVSPANDVVIVRHGTGEGNVDSWSSLFIEIAEWVHASEQLK
jgi:CubicO group peptidase (beta-lactamase class C family)